MLFRQKLIKRVVQSSAEAAQGGSQSAEALTRDRAERRAAGSHAGRVWVRGYYRTTEGRRSWVRGHWQAAGERVGRSSPE